MMFRVLGALLVLPSVLADVLTIGIQAPLDDSKTDCSQGWLYWKTAQKAVEVIREEPWWKETGHELALEYLPSSTSFDAWRNAQTFAESKNVTCPTDPSKGSCKVIPLAIVGPSSSASTAQVQLVSKHYNIPHFSYSATVESLTPTVEARLNFEDRSPFWRLNYVDSDIAGALWNLIQRVGWQQVSVLYSRDDYGNNLLNSMLSRAGSDVAVTGVSEYSSASVGSEKAHITGTFGFDPTDPDTIRAALSLVESDPNRTRVLVLFANSVHAGLVFQVAHERGMYGKGWVWLGGPSWVREHTWSAPMPLKRLEEERSHSVYRLLRENSDWTQEQVVAAVSLEMTEMLQQTEETSNPRHLQYSDEYDGIVDIDRETAITQIRDVMRGVVGVIPTPLDVKNNPIAKSLDHLTLTDYTVGNSSPAAFTLHTLQEASGYGAGAFSPPHLRAVTCINMFQPPATTVGLPLDLFAPFVFDAIWGVANAAAAVSARNNHTVSPSLVVNNLHSLSVSRVSPLTRTAPYWLANGDRVDIALSAVNVQDSNLVPIGTWETHVRPSNLYSAVGRLVADGKRHGDGLWKDLRLNAVIWPSGSSLTPPDRANASDTSASGAFLVAILGVIFSLVAGIVLKRRGAHWIPESAAAILVGAAFGAIIRWLAPPMLKESVGFNGNLFLLVFLPVIIFQAGFSLDTKPFFSQLFSISLFAIAGTIISTLVIGGLIYSAGSNGTIASLSLEEAFSFASLLSATDPVSTGSILSSFRVNPTLHALVYGESVLNDAIAIVLYRVFTRFLVQESSNATNALALFSFLFVLLFSIAVGYAVGGLATWILRVIHIQAKLNETGLQRQYEERRAKEDRELEAQILAEMQEDPYSVGIIGLGSGTELAVKLEKLKLEKPLNLTKKIVKRTIGGVFGTGTHQRIDADLLIGIGETSMLLLFAYASFSLCEVLGLSGIVSALFTGIAYNWYTRPVMTKHGREISYSVIRILATIAEVAVFFQIGLNVVLLLGASGHHGAFIVITILGCLVGRIAHIFPLSIVLNCFRRKKITFPMQLQLAHSGFRGAVAFAIALTFPSQNRAMVVNATAWVCLFTIFASGSTTSNTLRLLKIPHGEAYDEARKQLVSEEQAALASFSTTSSLATTAKALISFLDRKIQRIIYGPVLANVISTRTADVAYVTSNRRSVELEVGKKVDDAAAASAVVSYLDSWGDDYADDEDVDGAPSKIAKKTSVAVASLATETSFANDEKDSIPLKDSAPTTINESSVLVTKTVEGASTTPSIAITVGERQFTVVPESLDVDIDTLLSEHLKNYPVVFQEETQEHSPSQAAGAASSSGSRTETSSESIQGTGTGIGEAVCVHATQEEDDDSAW